MSGYLAATPKDLGELVRGFRKQRGWTQARLADQAGLFPKTVSAIETGSGQVLLANVMRCLSALDLDLSLDSRTAIRTRPDPTPTAVIPQPTKARVRITSDEPRRPPARETAASPAAATKRPRSSLASRTNSAAKALKEKW